MQVFYMEILRCLCDVILNTVEKSLNLKTTIGNPCWQPRATHRWPPHFPSQPHRWPPRRPWPILWWPGVDHRWGKISCCIQNIAKIVTRTCINFDDTPAFTSALSAFVCFVLAIIVLQQCLHRDSRTRGAKIFIIAAELLECRSKFLKI